MATCKLLLCGLIQALTSRRIRIVCCWKLIGGARSARPFERRVASIPRPVVDLRPGIRFELASGYQTFPLIDKPESTNRTREEWNAELRRTVDRLLEIVDWTADREHPEKPTPTQAIITFAPLMGGYTQAKKALERDGFGAEEIAAMPVGKAIAIAASRSYRRYEQSHAALVDLPYQQFLVQQQRAGKTT